MKIFLPKIFFTILIIGLISGTNQVVAHSTPDSKYQYIEIVDIGSEEYTGDSIEVQRRVIRSIFFKGEPDIAKASLMAYTPTSGKQYIKRSDNHVYSLNVEEDYCMFPTINGNHPTRYIIYEHLEINPNVRDANGIHIGTEFKYQVYYFYCLENAKLIFDELRFDFGSIWTPTNIFFPSELVPIKNYVNPVYNIPYPFVRAGSYRNNKNIYDQVKVDDIVFFYDTSTADLDFSSIQIKSTSQIATSLDDDYITSCISYFTTTPAITPLTKDTDILVNVSAFKDPDHCVNLNTNISSTQASNSFLCSSYPDSKYNAPNSYNNIIEQVYVVEACTLDYPAIKTAYDTKYLSNVFYRAIATNPAE